MRIAMLYDARDVVWWWRVHVENLCKNLINNFWCEVDIFTRNIVITNENKSLDFKNEYLWWKLHIIRCGSKTKFFNLYWRLQSLFAMFNAFLKYNKRKKYDIIHWHTYLPLVVWKLLSVFTKIPIVATIHWSQIMDVWKKSLAYYIEKRLLTWIKYDCEIAVWKNFLSYKNKNKPINIGNGVNMSDFTVNKEVLSKKEKYKLLFVGRLDWTKWVDVLINSIEKLVDRWFHDFILNIVWYGYDEEIYKKMVSDKRLWKNIHFVWQKTWKELKEYYATSDIMIVPSRAEWFGIIILEAMASWIPVIATKSGWPEDIIQNWENWFLVENENSSMISDRILSLINMDKKELNKIISNGFDTIKKKYTWKIIAEKVYQQYLLLKKN